MMICAGQLLGELNEMTTRNQCQFWDCNESIRSDHYLCLNHYNRHIAGSINKCPACEKYKDAEFDVCRNCYRQAASAWAPKRANAGQQGNREFAADKDADRFFVYVLLMNNGRYYVGQTREIHERLHEHRNGMSYQTRGREPKLQWFTTVATRKEAADLEAELQRLNSNPAGRREINRWVVDFKKLADELDYEPHNATSARTVQERRRPYGGITPPTQPRDGQNSRISNVLNAFRRKSGS